MEKFLTKKSDFFFIFLIILFVFLIRTPFFFVDFLDSDEATLILKGLAIVKGKIPYVDFHNFKPPISSYFLALPIYIADNSLFVIRFFTALIISSSCILLYKIGIQYNFSKINSFLTSLVFAISVSFITRSIKSQSFYSEHLSILLILISFYLFLNCFKKENNFSFFIQGCLLGIATLNTPYLVFFSIIFTIFPFLFLTGKFKKKIVNSSYIILGGSIILVIFLLYFYPKFNNIIPYLFQSALSDHSSNEIYPVFKTIYLLIGAGLQVSSIKFFSAFFIWVFGFFGFLHIFFTKNFKQKNLILVTIVIILSISIVLIGYPSGRYLIIISPFYCLLLTYFLNLNLFKNIRFIKIIILICIFLFPSKDWYKNIIVLKKTDLNKRTLSYGKCTDLYKFLESKKLLNKKIYFQDCHIIKFFINQLPVLDVYHPSDIYRKNRMKAFGKENLGDDLFNTNPEILVLSANINEFLKKFKFNKINPDNVLIEYEYLYKNLNYYIYKK